MTSRHDHRHLATAEHIARRSKDSTKVGAVLVSTYGAELLNAYNGPSQGVRDIPERFERPTKYLFASHAEANLIAFAARHGIRTDGCTVYVTHHPCASCARTLIQAGIRRVVYGAGTFTAPDRWAEDAAAARIMCEEAGVKLEEVAG